MVYFAKIKRIDEKREKCTVVFDDKSQDEADFSQIHSGKRMVEKCADVGPEAGTILHYCVIVIQHEHL